MRSAPIYFSCIPFSIIIKLPKCENYNIQKFTLTMKMYANGKVSMSGSKNLSQLKHNNLIYKILKRFHEVMFLKNKPCKLLDIHNKKKLVVVILFYVLILRIMCPSILAIQQTNTLKKNMSWT